MATEALRALPTAVSTWADIRKNHLLYVDKTELILDLVSNHKRAFIARPQGFGKTLLNSILTELFRHGDQSFEGTAIYGKWTRPLGSKVISCNFSGHLQTTASGLKALICDRLLEACRQAGFAENACEQLSRAKTTASFFKHLKAITAEDSLVFLIDDWDRHLVPNLTAGKSLFNELSKVLAQFFAELEALDNVEFTLVTGTLRYSGGCPWAGSKYNLTLDPHYATLLGYTESELENFMAHAQAAAERYDIPTEGMMMELCDFYGGFCFDELAETELLCPYEINAFFAQLQESDQIPNFEEFWRTIPSRHHDLVAIISTYWPNHRTLERYLDGTAKFTHKKLASCSTYDELNLDQILLQLGYLKVVDVTEGKTKRGSKYACGFTNEELSQIFDEDLHSYKIALKNFGIPDV